MSTHLGCHRRDFWTAAAGAAASLSVASTADLHAHWQSRPGRKLGVGLLGTKHAHAQGKLETVLRNAEVFNLVGIVENDTSRRRDIEDSGPYASAKWTTQAELLSSDQVDLVLVEEDIPQLLSSARAAVDAGKHVHLDKPAGTDFNAFKQLMSVAQANRVLVQMGYMYRSNPAFQFLFAAAEQGWLGDIFEVHAVMSKKIGQSQRDHLARFQGGSMFELGCHLIDAVVILLGTPERVVAFPRQTHDDGLYDNCLAVLEYPKATATVRSSVVEVEGFGRRQFVVVGTQGTLAIQPLDRPQVKLTLEEPVVSADGTRYERGTQVVDFAPAAGRYDGDLLALAAAIRGQRAYPYSYEHDLAVQECVLQASAMSL